MTDVVEHPEEFDKGEFAWRRLFLCERVEVEFVDGEEPGMGKTRVSPDGCQRGHLTDPDGQRHWRADADRPGRAAAEWAGSDNRSDARTELRAAALEHGRGQSRDSGGQPHAVHGARWAGGRGVRALPRSSVCALYFRDSAADFCKGNNSPADDGPAGMVVALADEGGV